jgi:hypothetical protein
MTLNDDGPSCFTNTDVSAYEIRFYRVNQDISSLGRAQNGGEQHGG